MFQRRRNNGCCMAMVVAMAILAVTTRTTRCVCAFLHQSPIPNNNKNPNINKATTVLAAVPIIEDWEITKEGNVVGTVTGHPVIGDGDDIMTSPIKNPGRASRRSVVVTGSGSRYKLGEPATTQEEVVVEAPPPKQKKEAKPPKPSQKEKRQQAAAAAKKKKQQQQAATTANSNKVNGSTAPPPKITPKKQEKMIGPIGTPAGRTGTLQVPPSMKAQYQLTGDYVGPSAKYLLSERPLTSTSGKSTIHKAYRNMYTGDNDAGEPITIKISANEEAMEREVRNYGKVVNGGRLQRGGCFVSLIEFLDSEKLESSNARYKGSCALVMERGDIDLKRFINENGLFKGKQLRDAAVAAARCVESLHTRNLVWTDMKSENFVVVIDKKNDKQFYVKGIDLESATPYRDNPTDYSPEACPPEFATSFLEGEAAYFEVDYSYDIWSLGMLFYELSTGCGVFDGKKPLEITRMLSKQQQFLRKKGGGFLSSANGEEESSTGPFPYDPTLEPISMKGFDEVDGRFRDLVEWCLNVDPRKRPSIAQVLLHPYFLTTGFGAFSL